MAEKPHLSSHWPRKSHTTMHASCSRAITCKILTPGTWQNMDSYLETAKSEAITACNPSWPEIHRRSCGGRLLCHHHYNLCPRPFNHNNNDNNIKKRKNIKSKLPENNFFKMRQINGEHLFCLWWRSRTGRHVGLLPAPLVIREWSMRSIMRTKILLQLVYCWCCLSGGCLWSNHLPCICGPVHD